jgi:hypothetical protein
MKKDKNVIEFNPNFQNKPSMPSSAKLMAMAILREHRQEKNENKVK